MTNRRDFPTATAAALGSVRCPVDVPLANWAAYYLTPLAMEFFLPHAKTGLHERVLFRRASKRRAGTAERLVP